MHATVAYNRRSLCDIGIDAAYLGQTLMSISVWRCIRIVSHHEVSALYRCTAKHVANPRECEMDVRINDRQKFTRS